MAQIARCQEDTVVIVFGVNTPMLHIFDCSILSMVAGHFHHARHAS
jgi:hypothetical protein